MTTATKEIKRTNKYTNQAILAVERQVRTVAAYALNSYIHCFQFRFELKVLIITDRMAIL